MALIKGSDLEMDYEYLARAVFNCGRYGDPWAYASADEAARYFYESKEEGKVRLYTIIDIAINDNKQNEELVKSLLKIKEEIMKVTTKGQLITKIHPIIDLLNKHGY